MEKDKLRIFLAEDHSVVRHGLKLLINSQPDMEVVGEAGDGLSVLQQAADLKPDIVVMDVTMPEMNGAQATRQLKKSDPEIRVLALTVHEEKGYLRALLEAGASGYVLKRAAAEELIHAIHKVAEGGTYLDPSLADKVVSGFVNHSTSKDLILENELSERETEVLRLIANGYSTREIAAQLNISVKTVETYKSRAMEKLGLHSRSDIVRYAIQRDWLQEI